MKERKLSTLEKEFVVKAISEGVRIDGRRLDALRKAHIDLGDEWGHAVVSLGKTRVLAQTACEVVEPMESRPTEGQIHYNVELSPMASPAFEAGRPSLTAVEVQRVLERTLKECKAVDCESLCIVAGEKVWSVRVNIHVLDHGGNIVDAVGLAALASLVHFRRPHVDVIGDQVTIHPVRDHVPDPLSVLHRPICVTFAYLSTGEILVDPTRQEEAVSDGAVTIAINAHKEVCALHKLGGAGLDSGAMFQCIAIACAKSDELATALDAAVQLDLEAREARAGKRGPSLKKIKQINAAATRGADVDVPAAASVGEQAPPKPTGAQVAPLARGTAELGLFGGGVSAWDQPSTEGQEKSS